VFPTAGPAPDFGRRQRRYASAATVTLAVSCGLAVLFSASGSVAVQGGLFLLVGLLCTAAQVTGLHAHVAPLARRPWWLLSAASLLFLAGALTRPAFPAKGAVSFVPDALSLSGYLALTVALILWLRSGPATQRLDLVDASLVGLGATLAAWVLQVVPVLGGQEAVLRQALDGLYPVVDVGVLTLCVRIALTRSTRYPAFWHLLLGLSGIFAGDLVYSLALSAGTPAPSWAAVPYFVAFGAFGACGLHPSTRSLGTPAPPRTQDWSRGRLLGVGLALLVPTFMWAAVPAVSALDRLVRVLLVCGLTALVLSRVVRAINAFASSERLARSVAATDALTGLANRAALLERLHVELPHAMSKGQPVTVLFLDLDGFKLVNDSYGHAVGDELLVAAAARIRQQVRGDDFVARIGGDEFVVVSRHAATASAEGLAARLITSFEACFTLSVGPLFVSPSVGIASSDPSDALADADALLRDADTAMYEAKSTGRNRSVTFDASLREAVRTRIDIENGLRRALALDQFEVHYQPIVDMPTGELLGCEALLRWRHPERGLVSPATFIPIAEDSFLIVPIGRFVLQRAARDLARWRAQGLDLYVSVNVSARQLRDEGLLGDVAAALEASGLPGQALCLELTESALVVNPDEVQETLTALRTLGVSLAVDDFGTGYSALSYLRRFPFTHVKIDRSFVCELHLDTALVGAVVALAAALGLIVIAEGVETADQEEALRALGCRTAQGYRFGRPAPGRPDQRVLQTPERSAM